MLALRPYHSRLPRSFSPFTRWDRGQDPSVLPDSPVLQLIQAASYCELKSMDLGAV